MRFFIKDFFSQCDQIRSLLRIWSHLLKKSSLIENFIFCAVPLFDSLIFSNLMTIAQIFEILEGPERVSVRANFYFLFVTCSVFIVY